ncbi:hypothetical protein GTP58_14340 [Duganella sp. CY15W]|uniref:hypothetical protein n=1 Tax=Duganella sp. CY15W TaxID=2692172 RepID=UPI0013682E61|nr:hypothetical protein [Duganella sp. CY15W]MYM29505.1 hypothetical protein [Duganella sp. CY15W]
MRPAFSHAATAWLVAAFAFTAPAFAVDTWKEISTAENDLKITAGSPLDFSALLPAGKAGDHGPVLARNGRLVFDDRKDVPAKLNCVSLAWSPATGSFPDDNTAAVYAQQLKLHGYNVVRLHYVEGILMHKSKVDNQFDGEQLRRFYKFLAELKAAGIYWVIDMMSSDNGTIGNDKNNRWEGNLNLKFRVQLPSDQAAKDAWKNQVNAIYAAVNPYTQQSTLSDPALIAVNLVNEGEINYLATQAKDIDGKPLNLVGFQPELKQPFNAYLLKKYGTNENQLKADWAKDSGALANTEHLADGNIEMPPTRDAYSQRMATFQDFLTQLQQNSVVWMTAHLNSLGYHGLVTSYNNWDRITAHKTRSSLELIDAHGYFQEVAGAGPGATAVQGSQTDAPDLNFVARIASARHAGKPFIVTEYGQVFWNQYRFEGSVVTPAIAALQGWDMICMHGEGGVDLSFSQPGIIRKQAINPYGVGIDPVLRAGETLSALLFLRGDVAPSPNRVVVKYPSPDNEVPKDSGNAVMSDLRILGLLTGLEIRHPLESSVKVPGITVEMTPSLSNINQAARIQTLVDNNILPPHVTLANAYYQSDTGQFALDKTNRRITVTTPRSEVLSTATAIGNYRFNALKVTSIDGPALLSASTLNEGNLEDSKRILMIFATDAQNTGMKFKDTTLVTLTTLGQMPVQIRRGVAKASIKLKHKTPMRLIALDLRGNRRDTLASTSVESLDGIEWQFELDNHLTSFGPTTFFLLEEQPQ